MPSVPPITPPSSEAVDWLPDDPPPRISRLAGWVLIGLFAAGAITSVVLKLPENVRCRFTLIPEEGADPIQAPVQGVLQQVHAAEGQEVDAGATLFEIRSEDVLTWQTQLRSAEEDLRAMEERARRSEEAHHSLTDINEAGRQQVAQERAFRERYRDTVKDFVRRSRELRDLKLISEVELLKAELELAAGEKDLNITEQSYHKVNLERTQLETERNLQRSEEQAAIEKFKVTVASLRQRLVNCEAGILTIRAPYRAVITSVAQRNPGSVVHLGLELCQLARVDGHPVADLKLSQSGLDQVARGQSARLFFDAFPYQRYGTLSSRIDWVSPTAVVTGSELQFRARATLERGSFSVNGVEVPVRAGMMGEARIRVGERTLIEFVFEPLKALRERSR
ncbi:MAG TPA: HlyD family efflux transporter periplasmic adaptor subunit [Verrucomicrobiota bacterium]|nr:HlyD family efflux transporter periplasmic adaptor subunit [Verrucomicrobiota bacterium]